MTTARAFAQALLCETGQACERCRACQLVARGQHPDLHVIVPTPPESNPKGARTIRIGAVRELERQASLRPALAGRRVLVLDEADRMTDDAPQAFLKFLEEPPPDTVVILVLSGVRALPATVISRCQIVRFGARDGDQAGAAVGEALALLEAARAEGVPALFRRTDRLDREPDRSAHRRLLAPLPRSAAGPRRRARGAAERSGARRGPGRRGPPLDRRGAGGRDRSVPGRA